MVVMATFEAKERDLTIARNNVASVNGYVILRKNAMRERRNLKGMKTRLQDKSLMKRIHSWS